MSEATGRQEIERRLIEKSLQDEDFRRRLIEDPKGAVEQELGTRLLEGVEVRVVEESADTIYLVLPSEELSEQELDSVAGGFNDFDPTWNQNEGEEIAYVNWSN